MVPSKQQAYAEALGKEMPSLGSKFPELWNLVGGFYSERYG